MQNEMTTRRFNSPEINQDGRAVYGILQGEPVFNPDFKWPDNLTRPGDVWVCESSDDIKTR